MANSEQYLDEMKRVWVYVKTEWPKVGPKIAGSRGYRAVTLQSIRLAHPPLPIFMYLLGSTIMASNGTRVQLWGSLVPIVLWVLNVNYSQTRKSGLTSLAEKIAAQVDATVRGEIRQVCEAKQAKARNKAKPSGEEVGGDDDVDEPLPEPVEDGSMCPKPSTWSTAYQGGTIERCKERVAGDFNQIKEPKKWCKLPDTPQQLFEPVQGLHEK